MAGARAGAVPHTPGATSASAQHNPRSTITNPFNTGRNGKARTTMTTYDDSQLRSFRVGTVAFHASKDAPEETHALRVCRQCTRRVCVLRIQFDGPLRQGDCVGDGAPPRPRLGRYVRGNAFWCAHHWGEGFANDGWKGCVGGGKRSENENERRGERRRKRKRKRKTDDAGKKKIRWPEL